MMERVKDFLIKKIYTVAKEPIRNSALPLDKHDDESLFNLLREVILLDAQAEIEKRDKVIKILELKNKSSLANNLCPDHRDKQAGKSCLACTIEEKDREIAELKGLLLLEEQRNAARSGVIDRLRREEAKLHRLTELIESEEVREKVAGNVNPSDGGLIVARIEAINDFCAMLKEEMK
jgi:hypothetical protein